MLVARWRSGRDCYLGIERKSFGFFSFCFMANVIFLRLRNPRIEKNANFVGNITKHALMKLLFNYLLLFASTITLCSCATSKAIFATGVSIDNYEYVVFGDESTGDRELDDVAMMVQNEISNTKLTVVSSSEAIRLIANGKHVLSPHINVKSEKWDGGHTYITINFYDFDTRQSMAVIKSSGIGLTVSQDQNIALKSISKKLQEVF